MRIDDCSIHNMTSQNQARVGMGLVNNAKIQKDGDSILGINMNSSLE